MEILILPLVVLLLPLSLYLIFSIRKKGSGALPPGSEGWPILGENVELSLFGFQQLVRQRMQKYSPHIFRTSLLGGKTAVLCGPEGNKFVMTNESSTILSPWRPPSMNKVLLLDLDQLGPLQTKATLHSFSYNIILKGNALKEDVAAMDASARTHLSEVWRPDSVVKALPSANRYVFEVACRLFLGVADPARLRDKLLEPLSVMNKGMLSLPIYFPWTAYYRAVGAGRTVQRELLGIVEERWKELREGQLERQDLLSKMVAATAKDGDGLSDGKVVIVLLGLFITGNQVAASLTIVLNFLAQLPHIYDQVFKEQMEIANSNGGNLTWEDTRKMKYTWNVVCESLRLLPAVPGAYRVATTEFKYAGFTIPKGWKVYWTAHSTNKNPDYFPDPDKFDPLRFEGSGPAPYTYVPFGAGPRMCPGKDYAKLAMLVFLHNLVTRFRLQKLIPNEKMLFDSVSTTPAHGLPLRLHPHQK